MVDKQKEARLAAASKMHDVIVDLLLTFLPPDWPSAELHVTFGDDGVKSRVICPDTQAGWTVSQEMIDALLDLDEFRRRFEFRWRGLLYSVILDTNEKWQAQVKVPD